MSSMKKAAFAALVLSATSVFAASPLYYGAGFGMGQNNSKFTSTATTTAGAVETAGTGSITTGGTSGQIFGFVGYQLGLSDTMKASIQADIGYDSLNTTVYEVITAAASANTSTLNIKSGFDYGVSGRLGMVHGDYAPYLIAGVRVGQWSATVNNTVDNAVHFIRGEAEGQTIKKTVIAPELGLGVQFTLSDNIDGRMEYKYALGGSFSGTDEATVPNTYKLTPRQQSVQLSFIF